MISKVRFVVALLLASSSVIKLKVLALSAVSVSFRVYGIVPDVISKAPNCEVAINYPSGVRVHLGNELTPTQVKDIPNVRYNAEPGTFYTLAFVDPDAPSRAEPTLREWKHWIVGNIIGSDVNSGETLAEYMGSAPPYGTGLHRYVFLVFQQPGFITFDEPRLNNTSSYNRTNFSVKNFAEKYSLGDPVAGNFFQAQNDDYLQLNI